MRKRFFKKKDALCLFQNKKYIINQFYILNQSTVLNSLPSLWSAKSFSLLCSFTALVERGETLERVPTGKQTHGEKVAVRLRPRLDKASTLNGLITIPGQLTYVTHSGPQHKPDQNFGQTGLSAVPF